MLYQVFRPKVMARYDWLVDFGDVAPQTPQWHQQPASTGRLHWHLIRPVIADDLPVGASFGSSNHNINLMLGSEKVGAGDG